jgi:hypothetical protein
MIDVLIVLVGAALGLVSASLLRVLNSVFGVSPTTAGAVAGAFGLVSCLKVLTTHWGDPAMPFSYSWQYTPYLMFSSCLGVFFGYLAFDWYRSGDSQKRSIGVASRQKQFSHSKFSAVAVFLVLVLVFALVFLMHTRAHQP